jgi:hypothetical protein
MDIGDKAKIVLAQLVDGWTRGTPQLAVTAGPNEMITLPVDSGATADGSSGSGEGPSASPAGHSSGER